MRHAAVQQQGHQPRRAQRHATQVQRHGPAAQRLRQRLGPGQCGQAQPLSQGGAAGTAQPVQRCGAGGGRRALSQRHHGLGNGRLVQARRLGQRFNRMHAAVLGVFALGRKRGVAAQGQQRGVCALKQRAPVSRANGPQAADGIADALVVGRCFGAGLRVNLRVWLSVGVSVGVSVSVFRRHGAVAGRRQVLVRQMSQMGQVRQLGQVGKVAAHRAFGQPAQVFHQHHPQRGWQRPQLAQRQRRHALVAGQKRLKQRQIQRAVAVRHPGPCHPIDARQPGQRSVGKAGQALKIPAWQRVPHLVDLALHQLRVVQQPGLCRVSSGTAAVGLQHGDGSAPHPQVLVQTRKERARPARACGNALRGGQAAAVLGKALGTEQHGAHRRLGAPRAREREELLNCGVGLGRQAQCPVTISRPASTVQVTDTVVKMRGARALCSASARQRKRRPKAPIAWQCDRWERRLAVC